MNDPLSSHAYAAEAFVFVIYLFMQSEVIAQLRMQMSFVARALYFHSPSVCYAILNNHKPSGMCHDIARTHLSQMTKTQFKTRPAITLLPAFLPISFNGQKKGELTRKLGNIIHQSCVIRSELLS